MLRTLLDLYRKNKYISLPLYHISRPSYFHKMLRFLKKTEQWSREQMFEWQFKQMKTVVAYALEHVPFYKSLYNHVGIKTISDINVIEDFKRLPTITKDDIKKNLSLFISDEAASLPKVLSHTGGSTDKPMEFYIDKNMPARENAFYEYYWRKFGFGYGDKAIILRGHHLPYTKYGVACTYDMLLNHKIFDTSYISDPKRLEGYDKEIKQFRAKIVCGYPSIIYALAKNYISSGIKAPQFDYCFLASENIYESQLSVIQKIFDVKHLLFGYGHSEFAALALKYSDNTMLGFFPQYGYTELLDEQDQDVSVSDNSSGEITATGWSKVMPFIRYKTGDYAVSSSYRSNDFMRLCMSVKQIEGRKQEYIISKSGAKLPLVNIAGAHLPSLSLIGDMQYEQPQRGILNIYVTSLYPNERIPEEIIKQIKDDYIRITNGDFIINVRQISNIKRTKAGKRIMLLQQNQKNN